MRSFHFVIVWASIVWTSIVWTSIVGTSDAVGLNAQEPRPQSENAQKDASAGIATGYRGHFACQFFSGDTRELAIAASDLKHATVAHLLESGADINAKSDASPTHMTILQVAVLHEWGPDAVRLLIEAGADVNARDRGGDTVLTTACKNPFGGNRSVVVQLLKAGAAIDGKGASGMTPLMCAALYDRTGRVVETLIGASADVAMPDKMGWTPLMHATRRRREHMAIVQMLAKAGSPINARHKGGGTALSNAAYNGHTQSVELLIRAGADVNSSDNASWTPLIGSSMNGHAEIVRLLLKSGARLNQTDRLGRTALKLARYNGQEWVEELLVQAGAR